MRGWTALHANLAAAAQTRRAHGLERTLVPPRPGLIDLSHNDYLGLRADAAFQKRCQAAGRDLPMGAGASRLLGGEWPIFAALEHKAAAWKGAESALYFSSGYAANEAIFRALAGDNAHFFSDALNHASMIDGLKLAKIPPGQMSVFPHRDLNALETMLAKSTAAYNVLAVESVYSMDGDLYPLAELAALAERYSGVLVIDEAHALGVFGPKGEGLAAAAGLDPTRLIAINPCGKAMASCGAFISGPAWLRDHLINTARSFIFSTGPSPWVAAGLAVAIDHVSQAEAARARVLTLARHVREHAETLGFETCQSRSPIVPIVLGENATALAAAELLLERGIFTRAIRPPTVPPGTARLRLSLHAGLDDSHVSLLCDALSEVRRKLCASS